MVLPTALPQKLFLKIALLETEKNENVNSIATKPSVPEEIFHPCGQPSKLLPKTKNLKSPLKKSRILVWTPGSKESPGERSSCSLSAIFLQTNFANQMKAKTWVFALTGIQESLIVVFAVGNQGTTGGG